MVHIAYDFNTAYDKLREHVSDEIGERPGWGATQVVTSAKTFDILGYDKVVRMRYEIAVIRPDGYSDNGQRKWMREADWLAREDAAQQNNYAMYVDTDCEKTDSTKSFLLSGYSTLDKASNALRNSTNAYLAKNDGARLLERNVELVNKNGETLQRYQIVKGHWQDGEFVKEKSSLEKEALLRIGLARTGNPTGSALGNNAGNAGAPRQSREASRSNQTSQTPSRLRSRDAPAGPRNPSYSPITAVSDEDEDVAMTEPDDEQGPVNWCTCQSPYDGNLMIACDNDNCPIGWYHARCLGLTQAPAEDQWWCPTCAPVYNPQVKGKETAKAKPKSMKRKPSMAHARGKVKKL